MRTAYDFSPLHRSMIGVDRVAEPINSAVRTEGDRSYPLYNVEKTADDGYHMTLAAAGFGGDEFELAEQPNLLVVVGRKAKADNSASTYLHRGVGSRDCEQRLELADYVVVRPASYDNGLLAIDPRSQSAWGAEASAHRDPSGPGFAEHAADQQGRERASSRLTAVA